MLASNITSQITSIAARFPDIEKVLLFGSRAHGDHSPRSDIDLAIIAPDMTSRDWLTFTDTLEEELETLLKIDVINLSTASKKLVDEVDQCKVVLYQRGI
ncbi:nucleotidyltransferase domain-containing protein [Bacillus sp. ISL-55]|uniref:nucleotidyltransferase domain-containing protein n=1 Tax=Bacillus sp. ISL-55 TaxID=2819134 RepID=UPI001BE5D381|nr:nucleotidyltransferase domain-containing protein [Bacillus sp. ISL-55]MBT2694476.1 nucleotidyltransferase domain-containing protein [Bacillus sp. ISL-55]